MRNIVLDQTIREMKRREKCMDCGEDDPDKLVYHHISDLTKRYNISDMVSRGYPLNEILDEIKKCICLCHNHHMSYHRAKELTNRFNEEYANDYR